MKWVRLKRYLELSGDTRDAVSARRRTGKWLEGLHYQVRDGKVWINTEAVEKWVRCG